MNWSTMRIDQIQTEICKDFCVTGCYYTSNGHDCRKYLDLKCKKSEASEPDIMVIMMNPGGSEPQKDTGITCAGDPRVGDSCKLSKAKPDRTQIQITRVMRCIGLHYARVLNLSDLRNTKSEEFYKFLGSNESQDWAHSVFDPRRKEDLCALFEKNAPVILGWGVCDVLQDLSGKAMDFLRCVGITKPAGRNTEGNKYNHPYPPDATDEWLNEWVQEIVGQIRRYPKSR